MEIRFFKTSEKELLLDSIRKLWNPNHIYVRNPAVLEHLVLNTPYRAGFSGVGNYSFLGIWENDHVIGILGTIPQEINIIGKKGRSSTFTIWAVDKGKRGVCGLTFQEFLDTTGLDMKLAIGLSPMAYKIYNLLGWMVIEDVPRWVAVNRVEETVKHLLPNDSTIPYLPRVIPCNLKTRYKIEIDTLNAKKWDRFYSSQFAPMTIGTCRDYKFLKWRYMDSPVLKYHFLTLSDEKEDCYGLAVVRIEHILDGRYRLGRILEFIAVEAEASILLANAVVGFDPSVLMWDFYCLSDVTAFGLEAVGFRKIPVWMNKVMMPTRFQPVDYNHMKLNAAIWLSAQAKASLSPLSTYQWYITKGDADQDRAN
ncbi:MAG: hypothetical protein IJ702_08655 [Fretibacterium sp.]|nr:hypothetical protein [Fretibacterium sp.]